jgi:chromosome segregation ATPase
LLPHIRRDLLAEIHQVRHDLLAEIHQVRHDLLAEIHQVRRFTDALRLELESRVQTIEGGLEEHRARINSLNLAEQNVGAMTQHVGRLLECQSQSAAKVHQLEQKLVDVEMVTLNLPGALREARRSDRETAKEQAEIRRLIQDVRQEMDLLAQRLEPQAAATHSATRSAEVARRGR